MGENSLLMQVGDSPPTTAVAPTGLFPTKYHWFTTAMRHTNKWAIAAEHIYGCNCKGGKAVSHQFRHKSGLRLPSLMGRLTERRVVFTTSIPFEASLLRFWQTDGSCVPGKA